MDVRWIISGRKLGAITTLTESTGNAWFVSVLGRHMQITLHQLVPETIKENPLRLQTEILGDTEKICLKKRT